MNKLTEIERNLGFENEMRREVKKVLHARMFKWNGAKYAWELLWLLKGTFGYACFFFNLVGSRLSQWVVPVMAMIYYVACYLLTHLFVWSGSVISYFSASL